MFPRTLNTAASAFAFAYLVHGASYTISAPANAPSTAAGPVDNSYIGFGIESSSFPDYAGRWKLDYIL